MKMETFKENISCNEQLEPLNVSLQESPCILNLTTFLLQVAGYTSSKDGCQSVIDDLARDILNQRDHR